jgi:UDP-N-acetylglucosamine--N-acetylmuramyl-(pentapeptide) pyrophosphoryl-undecaprenol N-acetylglucosamine transferase
MCRWAALTTGAFEAARTRLNTRRFVATGNPIRSDIGRMSKAEALRVLGVEWSVETPAVLVMGGSQGARTINQALVEALPRLLDDLGVAVIHQTGTKLFEETRAALPAELAEHPRYYLRPYYADMAALYATADLAVCRAGSLSLGELYVCGVPSLLIPYPFAAANHQLRNAEASVAAGASRLLLNADCNGETLFREVRTLLSDAGIRRGMREFALKLGRPDATAHLVALIRELAG